MLEQLTHFFLAYGVFGLVVVAFAEASFFPVPPDALLIPLVLADPAAAPFYAALCTLSSSLGGLFGYYIGKAAGRPLLERLARGRRLRQLEELFHQYGGWAVAFAALTPVPYKLFTIAAGVFLARRRAVLLGSLLGRGCRFFFEVLVLELAGPPALAFLRREVDLVTLGLGLLLVAGALCYTWFRRKKECRS